MIPLTVPRFRLPDDKTPPTPRAQDARARRILPSCAILVACVIGTALGARWAAQNPSYSIWQFELAWVSLNLGATLPHIVERSLHALSRPRPRFMNSSIVIPGSYEQIGLVLTSCVTWLSAAFMLVWATMMHQPVFAVLTASATAVLAFFLCSRRPLADLRIAFGDRQTTTLTEEGIHFHFPPLLSIEEHKRNTEVWVRWKDHLAIGSVDDVNILFSGDLTHQGRWTISSHHLGLPYTGLDALMRHFGAHPEDRPLLSSPEGVTLVTRILKDARARLAGGAEEGAD